MADPKAVHAQWIVLRDYHGYEHVLQAGASFVHPKNGNIYFWACEKRGGTVQNLAIYRELGNTLEWQHVATVEGGGVDALTQVTPGSIVIGQGGALVVSAAGVPKSDPHITQTGFVAARARISGVDEPWGEAALWAKIAELEARIAALGG